jgi:hypothetical protein
MQYVRGAFPSFFRPAAIALACGLGAAGLSGAVSAQAIYKWVDERGIVNYGNAEIPKDREVSAVDTAPKVVVRSDPRPRDAASAGAKPSDSELLRQELARTREEVARLRQNVAAVNSSASKHRRGESYVEWREECERQRRVDCDDDGAYPGSRIEGGVIRQPVILRRPAVTVPKPIPVAPNKDAPTKESGKPGKTAVKPLAIPQ